MGSGLHIFRFEILRRCPAKRPTRITASGRVSGRRRSLRAAGFTLIELMIVVAIICSAMAVTLVMSARFVRGEKAPSAARQLLAKIHEARQAAISGGLPTRLRLLATTPQMTASSDVADANTPGQWNSLGGTTTLPLDMSFCAADNFVNLAAATPTCPLATTTDICFAVNGNVSYSMTGTCPGPNGQSGATLYATTSDNAHQYKLVIFGLTGLPRLIDRW